MIIFLSTLFTSLQGLYVLDELSTNRWLIGDSILGHLAPKADALTTDTQILFIYTLLINDKAIFK